MSHTRRPDMTWWKEARFGMFIHWGLYAIPAGEWNGERIPGIAEWIMNRARVPVGEYEKLAAQFNPVEFDADGIAGLARDAGMRYLVITSKHHDGFAMFKSDASSYNIVDATPFKRDVIGELAAACERKEVRFGVYYSQAQDWHHSDAAGNTWDWPDEDAKDFQRYLDEKVYPQVDELLSNYGRMSVLWFDTPRKITAEQSRALLAFVREKQPDCIVNSRLGPGAGKEWGDFVSMRDNQVPTVPLKENGETCATMNRTWGYSKFDTGWKTPGSISRILADVVAKNANYLLNIGPDQLGRVPGRSEEILREVGAWLRTNGEAIYATRPTPFPVNFDWGAVTRRPGRLYCHLFGAIEDLKLVGLRNAAKGAHLLDDPGRSFSVRQEPAGSDLVETTVETGAIPAAEPHRVLAIEIEGGADVAPGIIQQPDGSVVLESLMATDAATGESIAPAIMVRGGVEKSLPEGIRLTWEFNVLRGGAFSLIAECAPGDLGHEIAVEVNGTTITAEIREDARGPVRGNPHCISVTSRVGEVSFDRAGLYTLTLDLKRVNHEKKGFVLRDLKLTPAS